MPSYRIGKLKGRFVISIYNDAGERTHRYRLNSTDKSGADREAPGVFATLTRPTGTRVGDLWAAYEQAYEGRAILERMKYSRKALEARFWTMTASSITMEDCKAHIAERRKAGIKDGTIHTELSHLRNVVLYAKKAKLIDDTPFIARPPKPKRKEDRHITREQLKALIANAKLPHLKLAIVLLYTTAARKTALLGLKWERCKFESGLIDLRDPDITRPHKGRALVAMNKTARAALEKAKLFAMSEYVIEWGGRPVLEIKRELKSAASKAEITKVVSPHVLRHSAAVHMAEDGVGMEQIQQFLGHEDIGTTRSIYARFSPTYLRDAAKVLEL
jgi:site-specific recombinase XerD